MRNTIGLSWPSGDTHVTTQSQPDAVPLLLLSAVEFGAEILEPWLAIGAEAVLSAEEAANALSFVRSSITAMRWSRNSVSAVQLWQALDMSKLEEQTYEDGEASYLLMLGSEILARLGLATQDSSREIQSKATSALLHAIQRAYKLTPGRDAKKIIIAFCGLFGEEVQRANLPAFIRSRQYMDKLPSNIIPYEPLTMFARAGVDTIPQKDKENMRYMGLGTEKMDIIMKAIHQNVSDSMKAPTQADARTYPYSSQILRNESVPGLFMLGAKQAYSPPNFNVRLTNGSHSLVLNTMWFIDRVATIDIGVLPRTSIIITKQLIDRMSYFLTMEAGYVKSPTDKNIVIASDAALSPQETPPETHHAISNDEVNKRVATLTNYAAKKSTVSLSARVASALKGVKNALP